MDDTPYDMFEAMKERFLREVDTPISDEGMEYYIQQTEQDMQHIADLLDRMADTVEDAPPCFTTQKQIKLFSSIAAYLYHLLPLSGLPKEDAFEVLYSIHGIVAATWLLGYWKAEGRDIGAE